MSDAQPASGKQTKVCPECRSEVDAKARRCPHCRHKFGLKLRNVIAVVFIIGIFSSVVLSSLETARQKGSEVRVSSAAFDVPTLLGKDIDELKKTLGKPADDSEPTELQLSIGMDSWDKNWQRDGAILLATYNPKTREVTDLFISPENDTADTNSILKLGNLSESSSTYRVEFVKARNAPGYTGAIVTQK